MSITDQQMSHEEFAVYISNRIKTLHSQSCETQLIALSGPDCAGKSTLAADIQEQLNLFNLSVRLLSIDTFLIPRHLRVPNSSEFIEYFENAFDYSALVKVLESTRRSSPTFSSNSPALKQPDILLVEGVFLLRRELYQWWNLTVWIEINTSVIINRAIKRDSEYFGDEKTVRRVYKTRCLPAQHYHMQRDLPRQVADITAKFKNELWEVRTPFNSEIDEGL